MEATFEQTARQSVAECHELIASSADSMVEYSMLFIVHYELALNHRATNDDFFLEAYAYKALAERYGAPPKALDDEAYRIRREWVERGCDGR